MLQFPTHALGRSKLFNPLAPLRLPNFSKGVKMRLVLITLAFLLTFSSQAFAKCTKEEICQMMEKMNPFEILDKCPDGGPFLVECRKASEKVLEELPPPKFVDNGDGTISDTVNKLLWTKKGIQKKYALKDAKKFASTAKQAGKTGWRLPTLSELRTLIYHERVVNASGKKAWINPIFDDGRGHYYWTTTMCSEISIIEDRYQKKVCKQGDQAAWLVHFNINAVFWHYTKTEGYYPWLVQNLE